MKIRHGHLGLITSVALFMACVTLCALAQTKPAEIPAAMLIQPGDLAKLVQASTGDKPLIIQVGSRVLYSEAHIPGAEYLGPASSDDSRPKLRERVQALPHNQPIVLYCGCCPWSHCPNVKPAYQELQALGFTNVKVLYIANNFGADWVEKGYPVARGESSK
jgi:thiosulfate/3-mercaptopyruvate sulfurtransferase